LDEENRGGESDDGEDFKRRYQGKIVKADRDL
jgi:hypothetical protein